MELMDFPDLDENLEEDEAIAAKIRPLPATIVPSEEFRTEIARRSRIPEQGLP